MCSACDFPPEANPALHRAAQIVFFDQKLYEVIHLTDCSTAEAWSYSLWPSRHLQPAKKGKKAEELEAARIAAAEEAARLEAGMHASIQTTTCTGWDGAFQLQEATHVYAAAPKALKPSRNETDYSRHTR